MGSVKIGRYTCPSCNNNGEEERSFWEKLKEDFFGITGMINKLLRLHHVSYPGISDTMGLIYPQGRDTIFNAFADSIEKTVIPPAEDIWIVLYFVKGAPATNNGVKNYYSTSLKTHRKKQLRTDKGI